ncbi:hypothetical protein ACFC1R_30680 [Kitasatospora sp. NPDC056138]|uniref:hypothetical protein n=1 Tax=Kitasatospora sp. NPDC056138 TaxID=3345724 RepID=UPI0035DD474B
MSAPEQLTEYRIGRLQRRLAEGGTAELGVRLEAHGDTIVVTAVVSTSACRDELLAVIADELPDSPVHTDVTVVASTAPGCSEAIS